MNVLSVSVTSLCFTASLLYLQGYKSGDVTILTPYVGQLQKLRREMERYMTVVLNDRDLEMIPEDEVQAHSKTKPHPMFRLMRQIMNKSASIKF